MGVTSGHSSTVLGGIHVTAVFIVMAVQAKQFPVAAIRWIVVVVMIFVMHGEFCQIGVLEFAAATATYPRVELQCLIPVICFPLARAITGRAVG